MTKTDSFANHCVEAERNTENVNSQRRTQGASSESQTSTTFDSSGNKSKIQFSDSNEMVDQPNSSIKMTSKFEPTYSHYPVDKMMTTAEFCISSQEIQTNAFQNISTLQSDKEQATLIEASSVSPSSTALSPNVSGNDSPAKRSSQQPIRFDANGIFGIAEPNVPQTSRQNQQAEFTSVATNINTDTIQSTTTIQSDGYNGFIVGLPAMWDHSYNKPIQIVDTVSQLQTASREAQPVPEKSLSLDVASLASKQKNFFQAPNVHLDGKNTTTLRLESSSGLQSRTSLKSKQQDFGRTVPYTTKPKTYAAKAPEQKRHYQSSNKIIIYSNELINLSTPIPPPPIGSVIQTPSNSALRSKNHQITIHSKAAIQSEPVQMRSKLPTKNEEKSTAIIATAKSKAVIATPRLTRVMNTPRSTPVIAETRSTPVIAASLKRKNNDRVATTKPTKLQRFEEPVQVTTTKIAKSSISRKLPDMAGGVKMSAPASRMKSILSSDYEPQERSFSECVKLLKRNNVDIFRVPQKPSNEAMAKYTKMFKKNNVTFERAIKK